MTTVGARVWDGTQWVDLAGGGSTGGTGGGGTVSGKLIGIYGAGNNSSLDTVTSGWSKQPNLASFYMPWPGSIPSKMTSYAGQGRVIQVELATKGPSGYVTWANIATGTYDSQIIGFITALDTLGVRVMLSLDNEPDQKATSGTGEVQAGQSAASYVSAANHVFDLIHAHSARVESLMWFQGGGTTARAVSFLPAKAKLDNIGWDPYSTGSDTSAFMPIQRWAQFINNVIVPQGYTSIKRHLPETGIMTNAFTSGGSYTVAQQIAYYQSFPSAMDALNIESVIWFRDNAAHNYIPTDASVDTAFKNMLAATL